jgi:glycosyltransferase involved in cell wall biosynthesis
MSKKILVIAGGTYVSGAEIVTLEVIKGLKQKGFDLHCMVSGWNDGDFIERLNELNIPYTAIKLGWYYTSKIWWSLDSLVHYPKAIWDFIKLKRKFKEDIVYTISYRPIILLYPFFNKNIIYHVHDTNSRIKQSKFFIKLINSKVRHFIAVSHFIKSDLLACGLPEQKISVIHNGIEIIPINSKSANKLFTIGIVGQIIPRKGHLILIEALNILHEQGIKIKLKIVGRGDESFVAEIKKVINKNRLQEYVQWRGFIIDLKEIYSDIDVVVAPTQNDEPFGLMACEGNMFAIPAIVSNKGGLPEIIQDGLNGFLVNPFDAFEIADKIMVLYKDKNLREKMGKEGREQVVLSFSKIQMNQSIEKILNQL